MHYYNNVTGFSTLASALFIALTLPHVGDVDKQRAVRLHVQVDIVMFLPRLKGVGYDLHVSCAL